MEGDAVFDCGRGTWEEMLSLTMVGGHGSYEHSAGGEGTSLPLGRCARWIQGSGSFSWFTPEGL